MLGTAATSRQPIHRLAWLGFATAIVGLVLAWYGSLHAEKQLPNSPLREARGAAGLPAEPGPWYDRLWDRAEVSIFGDRMDRNVLALTERSRTARYILQFVAFVLPLALGLAATYVGASAMRAIEQSGGRSSGNFQAVCAIMIGGFAAVIAGCMMLSLYVWPHVPSLYVH